MNNDAVNLFYQDRKQFFGLYKDFLSDPTIPASIKREAIAMTIEVLRQIGELIGPDHG